MEVWKFRAGLQAQDIVDTRVIEVSVNYQYQ